MSKFSKILNAGVVVAGAVAGYMLAKKAVALYRRSKLCVPDYGDGEDDYNDCEIEYESLGDIGSSEDELGDKQPNTTNDFCETI